MEKQSYIRDVLTQFRPTKFAEIVGLDTIKKQLCNMIAKDAFPNAVLFSGAYGSGKTTLARIVARALICSGWKASQYEPCGVCDVCQQTKYGIEGMIAYFHSSRGISDNKLKDEIHGAKYNLNLWDTRKGVLFIDDIESLPKNQQRILRASLDDPWPGGVLIATTMDAALMDKPLRQRMVEMPVMSPLQDEVERWLKEVVLEQLNIKISDPKAVNVLIKIAELNFRTILKIVQTIYNNGGYLTIQSVKDAALQNGYRV